MDVTPQVINEVEFHQKMRGYDPDEVDDFLERVAVAVGQLQDKVREAADRTAVADRRAVELENRIRELQAKGAADRPAAAAADDAESTEAITRTLILAQRTADAAIQEAQDTAARTVQAAQEQAQRVYAEAQEKSHKLMEDAEAEARKSADETRQRLVSEIIALEEHRDSIRGDHGTLERSIEEHRSKLRNAIGDLQRLLDDQARLKPVPAPTLVDAPRPGFLEDELSADAHDADVDVEGDDAVTGESDELLDEAVDVDEEDHLDADLDSDDDDIPVSRPITGGVTFTVPPVDTADAAEQRPVSVEDHGDIADEEAWARYAGDEGPPTQAHDLNDSSSNDDAYLAELRKAMLDDTSAPRNRQIFDEGDAEERSRSWFGRRR